ncbi:hypothetical protein GQ457_01G019580 [Hibiscus cannabinus]
MHMSRTTRLLPSRLPKRPSTDSWACQTHRSLPDPWRMLEDPVELLMERWTIPWNILISGMCLFYSWHLCQEADLAAFEGIGIRARLSSKMAPKKGDNAKAAAAAAANVTEAVENFLWGMEKYFRSLGIEDDSEKVNIAIGYLTDAALIWWRRRFDDVKRGSTEIGTWKEFRTEFKDHYYPVHAERDAQIRMRHIKQEGSIKEYVREFSELMLEIPNLTQEDALINFMDGLQRWVRTELERRGVTEISKALTVAESLIEVGAKKSD